MAVITLFKYFNLIHRNIIVLSIQFGVTARVDGEGEDFIENDLILRKMLKI